MKTTPHWRHGKRDGLQHATNTPVRYARALCGAWHPFTGWIDAGPDCVLPRCPACEARSEQHQPAAPQGEPTHDTDTD